MEIIIGFSILALIAACIAWAHYGTAEVAEKLAHRLLAFAAGKRAQRAAVAEAMGKRVVLEARNG